MTLYELNTATLTWV